MINLDHKSLTKESLQSIALENQDQIIVFMIGYASDIGAYNFESRTGAEQGPASFKEIAGIMSMPADNAYYKVDTSQAKLKIFDCGDIKSDGLNLEPVQNELRGFVELVLAQVPDSIVVVIGGSDDLNYPCLKAASESLKSVSLIRIDPQIDLKLPFIKRYEDVEPPEEHRLEHHQSHFRQSLEDESILKSLNQVILFGIHGHRVLQQEIDYLNNLKTGLFRCLYLERDLRRAIHADSHPNSNLFTQGGKHLYKELAQISEGSLIANLDLSSIKANIAPGVSEPSPAFGFDLEEIEEIANTLGQDPRLRVLTLSEYNPAIEKFKTGAVLNRIWNSFLIGLVLRNYHLNAQ